MPARSPRKVTRRPAGEFMSKAPNRPPRKTAERVGSLLPPTAAIDPRRSLSAQVYELAREAIVSLWLKPGQAISEKEIASQLGVSRTPVREALLRLSDEGLIEVFRQSGTFVCPIKLHDVYEGLLIREALETAVVRQATRKFDRRFGRRFETLLARQRECAERGYMSAWPRGSWQSRRRIASISSDAAAASRRSSTVSPGISSNVRVTMRKPRPCGSPSSGRPTELRQSS